MLKEKSNIQASENLEKLSQKIDDQYNELIKENGHGDNFYKIVKGLKKIKRRRRKIRKERDAFFGNIKRNDKRI